MRVTCAAAFFPSEAMSLLWYLTREVKVLPGAEERGIGKKLTEEANKRVGEVLKQLQQPGSTLQQGARRSFGKNCEEVQATVLKGDFRARENWRFK